MLNTHINMSVISIICHNKIYLINVETHQITWKKVIFTVWKCPILQYFHEIQLVVSEYAKYLD